MNKNYYDMLHIANVTDAGGYYDLQKHESTIVYNNETYTYIATGFVRDVFISPDKLTVLKVPKKFDTWGFQHNRLEFECYNEAPDWCKNHIAISELTPEGFLIQEYLDINCDAGNYYRELGYRQDGTCVIFDCDIFLDSSFKKDDNGFKYQEVFSGSKVFGEAYNEAMRIPKRKRQEERENRLKYFPDLDFNAPDASRCRPKYYSTVDENNIRLVYINDILISNEIAKKCGL